MLRLYEVFTALDADGSGSVEQDELRDVLLRTGGAPIDDVALAQWRREADTDGDTMLSFAEFLRMSCVLLRRQASG